MSKIIELTKQLIAIPSWVDANTNENKIGNFIYDYLRQSTNLTITKEVVTDVRFNILAQNSSTITTLVIGHIDTVPPSPGWQSSPTIPIVKSGKIYGLGATDMKSGLAAMLINAGQSLPSGTAFLFYVGEEYDFIGLKTFIKNYSSKIKPKTIISLDGSDLKIANGCRGLIEIQAAVEGISCHAATPQNGLNAIELTFNLVTRLKSELSGYQTSRLGPTSLNLAAVTAGTSANIVPDYCRFLLDIRPGSSPVTGSFIANRLNRITADLGGQLVTCRINHDLGCWWTPKYQLKSLGLPFKDISATGYIDIQMLWQSFGQPVCLTIGAGDQSQAHKANEFVTINKLNRLPVILKKIINNL